MCVCVSVSSVLLKNKTDGSVLETSLTGTGALQVAMKKLQGDNYSDLSADRQLCVDEEHAECGDEMFFAAAKLKCPDASWGPLVLIEEENHVLSVVSVKRTWNHKRCP